METCLSKQNGNYIIVEYPQSILVIIKDNFNDHECTKLGAVNLTAQNLLLARFRLSGNRNSLLVFLFDSFGITVDVSGFMEMNLANGNLNSLITTVDYLEYGKFQNVRLDVCWQTQQHLEMIRLLSRSCATVLTTAHLKWCDLTTDSNRDIVDVYPFIQVSPLQISSSCLTPLVFDASTIHNFVTLVQVQIY